jgi:hypothetical protein
MPKIIRDFSHWQIIDDYPAVRDSADAFIIKAYDIEYGAGNPEKEDPAHDDHYFGLRPKPVAEYLYLDPGANARTQVLGYMAVSYRGFLDLLDVEEDEGLPANTVTSRVVSAFENFILEAGRKAWLYSNLNFLDNKLKEPVRIAELIEGIMLAWPSDTATRPRMPKLYPPELVKIWQKSWDDEVDGVSGPSDMSVWLGTDAEYNQLVKMPPIPPPPTDILEPRVATLEEQMAGVESWITSFRKV